MLFSSLPPGRLDVSVKGCQDLLDCVPGRSHAPDGRCGRLRSLSARSGGRSSKAEDLSRKSTPARPVFAESTQLEHQRSGVRLKVSATNTSPSQTRSLLLSSRTSLLWAREHEERCVPQGVNLVSSRAQAGVGVTLTSTRREEPRFSQQNTEQNLTLPLLVSALPMVTLLSCDPGLTVRTSLIFCWFSTVPTLVPF